MKTKSIQAVDLFCGAGGTSSGLIEASNELGIHVNLTAINHWDIAIQTHSKNHPDARHLCENLNNVDPQKLFTNRRIDLLAASPECTHFSKARGDVPCSDQSRSSGWHIVRWAESLYIDNILIENVPEFTSWGPLGADGKPMPSKAGQTFRALVMALESLGYKCSHRIVNTADYGDPTERPRFFMICRRGNKKNIWPEHTHSEHGGQDLFHSTEKWKSAKSIIDWSIPGKSIFTRKKPLTTRSLDRIEHGLKRYGGENAKPFLALLYGTSKSRDIDRPVPTITAKGQHIALVEPFFVKYYGSSNSASINKPLGTITTKDRFGLVLPSVENGEYDIRYRMLQPHELAAAQGFPKDYHFCGNKSEKIKQIGNAVPVNTAKSLCRALLAS
jgi:DNA (cytosine-5)-methyltransferase 1